MFKKCFDHGYGYLPELMADLQKGRLRVHISNGLFSLGTGHAAS